MSTTTTNATKATSLSFLGLEDRGRLGNQLFQIAGLYSLLARTHPSTDQKLHPRFLSMRDFSYSWSYNSYFQNLVVQCDQDPSSKNGIITHSGCCTDSNLTPHQVFTKPLQNDMCFYGYFQNSEYISRDLDSLWRVLFAPSKALSLFVNQKWLKIEEKQKGDKQKVDQKEQQPLEQNISCAVHMRFGDYVTLRGGSVLLPESYYHWAIQILIRDIENREISTPTPRPSHSPKAPLTINLLLVLFSDDMVTAETKLKTILSRIHFRPHQLYQIKIQWMSVPSSPSNTTAENDQDPNKDIVDLFVMSRCDHHIIANSTFSWWGARLHELFYSKESKVARVFIPDPWFPHDTSATAALTYPNWIKIDPVEIQRIEAERLEAQRIEAQRLEAQRLENKRLNSIEKAVLIDKKDTKSDTKDVKCTCALTKSIKKKEDAYQIHPLGYAIPDSLLLSVSDIDLVRKKRLLADLIPGELKTYRFGPNDFFPYMDMYRASRFAITTRKGGWDCLRTWEILANGCIPIFSELDSCPKLTMSTFPRQLLQAAYLELLPWQKRKTQSKKHYTEMYRFYQEMLLCHTYEFNTTSKLAERFLNIMTLPQRQIHLSDCKMNSQESHHTKKPNRILILVGDMGVNYQRELFIHGLRQVLGENCIEYPKVPVLYKSFAQKTESEREKYHGFGFTCGGLLDDLPVHKTLQDSVIQTQIENQYYDLIVYAKIGRYDSQIPNVAFWNSVQASIQKHQQRVAFLFGGDEMYSLKKESEPLGTLENQRNQTPGIVQKHLQYGHCFVRELED